MSTAHNINTSPEARDYLTIVIADQRFGIPVLQVQDVLREQKVTRIPLSAPEIAGSLNLRGRIVTAINVRKRLNLPPAPSNSNAMSVVVEHEEELYSLIIDRVGEVITLEEQHFERNPGTLDATWRDVSMGIYQLENELLIVMDVKKLLSGINHNT